MALLDDLNSSILAIRGIDTARDLEFVPAERSESNLEEGILEDDSEVVLGRVISEGEVDSGVCLVVAGLEADGAASGGPARAVRRRRVHSAARRRGLRLAVVAAVRRVVEREVRAGQRQQHGEEGGGTHFEGIAGDLLLRGGEGGGGVCVVCEEWSGRTNGTNAV